MEVDANNPTRKRAEAIPQVRDCLLNIEQVGAMLGYVSVRTVRNMLVTNQLPKPIQLFDRDLVRWRLSDIEKWITSLPMRQ